MNNTNVFQLRKQAGLELTSVLCYLATISHCTSSAFQYMLEGEMENPGTISSSPSPAVAASRLQEKKVE